MTISIPPPSDSLVPAANAPAADAVAAAPAEGFDQFMDAGTPVVATDDAAAEPVTDAPANEQAAVLAASLLWAPMPLLVETPPPALPETIAGASGALTGQVEGDENILSAATTLTNEAPVSANAGTAEFRAPQRPKTQEAPAGAPSVAPETRHLLDDVSLRRPASGAAPTKEPGETLEIAAAAIESQEAPTISLQAERSVPKRPSRAGGRGEKIADTLVTPTGRLAIERSEAVKTFVSPESQAGKMEEGIVGTSVAKPAAEMPYALADHRSAAAALASARTAPDGQHLQFDLAAHVEPAHQARDTVATVLSVIDAQEKPEATAHRTVNMDFDFGGEKLAVRVEFRDGTVRAHFRTQSLELRAALASEWSHVSAAPENILRAVEPVFVTSSRSEQSASFHADGGAQRQQQQAPAPGASPRGSGLRAARAVETAAPAAADEALRYRQPFTTRHLHAFA